MKKFSTPTSKKSSKTASNRGLYVTLAASVLMLGIAGCFAYSQTKDDLEGQLDSSISLSSGIDSADNANADKNGVKKDIYTTTAKTTAATTAKVTTTTTAVTAAPNNEYNNAESANTQESQPMIYPVIGDIIADFSNGELVKSSTTGIWQTHNGIDIAANEGDAVKAMTSGTVVSVDLDPLWGYCVTVDHGNGITAKYCNLSESVNVSENDSVNAGTVIGSVGKSADIESAMPAHLHFEVLQYESYVNPSEIIG